MSKSGGSTVNYELLASCDHQDKVTESYSGRKGLAYADHHFTDYQLEKLKLLAGSVLQNHRAETRNAEDVTSVYELLKKQHGDVKAMSLVYVLLTTASKQPPKPQEQNDVLADSDFKWRSDLLQYSDRAKKEKKITKLVDYLFKNYRITLAKETFTCDCDLIALFNHMIEMKLFIPGRDEDLVVIGKAFNTCKNRYYNYSGTPICGHLWDPEKAS